MSYVIQSAQAWPGGVGGGTPLGMSANNEVFLGAAPTPGNLLVCVIQLGAVGISALNGPGGFTPVYTHPLLSSGVFTRTVQEGDGTFYSVSWTVSAITASLVTITEWDSTVAFDSASTTGVIDGFATMPSITAAPGSIVYYQCLGEVAGGIWPPPVNTPFNAFHPPDLTNIFYANQMGFWRFVAGAGGYYVDSGSGGATSTDQDFYDGAPGGRAQEASKITIGLTTSGSPPTPPTPPPGEEAVATALIGFTFNREQQVIAWHRHPLGGVAQPECVETIHAPNGEHDETWLIVKRTVNGETKRYIEYMEKAFNVGDDLENAFFVDCGLTYFGAPTTTISGLDHLEGETVVGLADGKVVGPFVVMGGSITLDVAAATAHIGYANTAKVVTMRLEAGAQDGTAQGKTKRITRATMRFLNTVGGEAGRDGDAVDPIRFYDTNEGPDGPVGLFTGDREIIWPEGYEAEARLMYRNSDPSPVTIVAIFPQVVTQDRG